MFKQINIEITQRMISDISSDTAPNVDKNFPAHSNFSSGFLYWNDTLMGLFLSSLISRHIASTETFSRCANLL